MNAPLAPVIVLAVSALLPTPVADDGAATPAANYREETIPLTLDDGRQLTANLRLPVEAPGKLPAIMLFGGFRNAATVLDRVHSERPLIWASFDYPFAAPRKFVFPDSFKLAPQMRAAIHWTFEGVGKLYGELKKHPRIDSARITVVGGSAGAPFATVGAAQHGIPGVILVQGFGDVTAVVHNLFLRKYKKKLGSWVKWPLWPLAWWIVWYCEIPDINAHARQLGPKQQVLAVTAEEDDYVPKEASEVLWAALQDSDAQVEQMELPGGHLGVGDDTDLIAEILQRSLVWMEKANLL